MPARLRVLTLQPFYGGSHQAFIDGWIRNSQHDWSMITLPDWLWKRRMTYSALQMSDEVDDLVSQGNSWDVIVATDMLNLAEFRSITKPIVRDLPTVVYFHENQFEYPIKAARKLDLSFAFTNLTTAMAADQVWFNSRFNLESMIDKIREQSGLLRGDTLENAIARIGAKATIQYPGIDLPTEKRRENISDDPIHLLWAARWEHDKNPLGLLKTLDRLTARNLDFQISVIGQCYEVIPDSLLRIKQKYSDRIVDWGYLPTRERYWRSLASVDVFISTANHEFFGLSAVEAIAAGAYPLLPNRLSYPEVLNIGDSPHRDQFFYDGTPTGLAEKIDAICQNRSIINGSAKVNLRKYVLDTYGWTARGRQMDDELIRLVQDHEHGLKFGPVL